MKELTPFVFWAQTEKDILLKIDLKNVKAPNITIKEDEMEYKSFGCNDNIGKVQYKFNLEFFLPIDRKSEETKIEVLEREVRVKLRKKEEDWWPRLAYSPARLPWLKVDFDRWKGDDDSEDEAVDAVMQKAMREADVLRTKYPDIFNKLQKEELGYIHESKRKIYLFCYNIFMFCAFLYFFVVLFTHYVKKGEDFFPETYDLIGNLFKMIHLLMLLEILHPVFGYTNGSVLEAAIQVLGRIFFLFILLDSEPRMQKKPVVFYLFMVYTLIELVRYPYYMLRVYDANIGLLTWLRYTIWIPLYPVGFMCEGVIVLRNIPYFQETRKFTVSLPNSWNFAFDFPIFLRVFLLFFFFPLMYVMMKHMYHQRCKRLYTKSSAYKRKNE